ncbi:MAG: response regulator transcription factor [Roseococcus sp.]
MTLHSYRVIAPCDARDFEVRLQREPPHLVLLEQRIGDMSGTAVLRRIRAVSGAPVIILTRISDQIERIINLETGADDEVHKSLAQRETLPRMRAVLRRSSPRSDARRGGWAILEAQRDVIRPDGSPCQLTTAEFGVLRLLVLANGEPVSGRQLSQHVFGRPLSPGDRAVDTVVFKLREKLGATVIVTVRPVGYALAGFAEGRERD